jgi:hypothetical protein
MTVVVLSSVLGGVGIVGAAMQTVREVRRARRRRERERPATLEGAGSHLSTRRG